VLKRAGASGFVRAPKGSDVAEAARSEENLSRPCYCLEASLMNYREAWALQTGLVEARRTRALDRDILLLVEHPAVYTLGRRGERDNIKVPESFLRARGIDVIPVERGGDITYHGPGQLVGYPVVDLRAARMGVVDLVTALEQIMIGTLGKWGIQGGRSPLNRGAWVGPHKIGSIGIAVRHGVSFHGFALNVNTSLEPFDWVNACGLKGAAFTSMERILGEAVSMKAVRSTVRFHVEQVLNVRLEPMEPEKARALLHGVGEASAGEGQ